MLDSLVELDSNIDDLTLDLRLASDNNFTGQQIYQSSRAVLHRHAAEQLKTAQQVASSLGLKLHIWDVFRPLEAQKKLWDHHPDARYISPPEDGPRTHCRGIAIDLTLSRQSDGQLLEMGTEFDDFRELAHHNNTKITEEALSNRLKLAGLMHTAGFVCHPYEWWHYQLADIEQYPVLTDRMAGTGLIAEEV